MTATAGDDLATWLGSLTLPGGEPLELLPWQRQAVDAIYHGRPPELVLSSGLRAGRLQASARALAVCAMLGNSAAIACTTRAQAEALFDLALSELQALGRALDLDVTPTASRITQTQPRGGEPCP